MREIETCPVCNKKESSVVYGSTLPSIISMSDLPDPYSAHYQINRCLHCGLLRASPVLNDEGINNLYRTCSETNVTDGEEENVRRTMQLYYNLVKPFLKNKQRMLDIGCDMGYLLDTALKNGFDEVYGLEPVPIAREIANKLDGAKISNMFYENTNYPESYFDLIVMIHVLDHLVDPMSSLKKAYRNLKPGGMMLAIVHNVESLLGRLMDEKFPPYNLYHFYYFTKKTLKNLFEAHGFEVVRVVSTTNCYSLGFFTERFPILPKSIRLGIMEVLEKMKLASIPLRIAVGNIGSVVRRPL